MRIPLLLLAVLLFAAPGRAQSDVPIEAEGGTLTGAAAVATTRAGYSGAGYVTGLDQPGDSLAISFEGTGDFVQLRLAVAGDSRFGSYEARLDGEVVGGGNVTTGGSFRELVVDERRLSAGLHTLTLHGTFDVDYLVLTPTAYEGPALPPPVLSDPDATPATEALFAFLLDIYGEHVLAGQQDGYQNGGPSTREIDYVTAQTGKEPAVGAFDLINYSPSRRQYGANPTGWAEHWIDWAGTDGIVTLMWHWNAPTDLLNTSDQPWWRGFYTEATTFDVEAALAEGPGGENYDLLLRDIDAIAVELQKFEDADVPVLWRPLHEAYGRWFWWGAKGPAPYVALWRLMYERLVDHHGLHNLIWVHTHRPEDGDQAAWYPGDDVVDVVGVDKYEDNPEAVFQSTWAKLQEQFGANKLVALTESGTLPDMTRSVDFGVTWSWFAIWEGDFIRDLDPDRLTDIYTSEAVLTRDELPDWRSYVLATAADATPTADLDRLSLAPNPSAGRPTLRLDLGTSAEVTIDVFDVTGRSVLRQSLGTQPAGPLAVPLHVDSSGTYLVRVTAGDRVVRGRFVVAR
ncbi:MAG: beta-mannosidase [Rhodothermaceae bacterium]|nr:beta-mannosidase [Rhodothermaceae bacterium]